MNCVVAARYSTVVLFTWRRVRGRATRVAEVLGTPTAGLRPRPVREKGFLSNLLID
jgi:hypothetical protein